MLSEEDIKRYIPHREPFLFVDKVLEIVPGTKIRAFKKFNSDEEFFKGHFQGKMQRIVFHLPVPTPPQ